MRTLETLVIRAATVALAVPLVALAVLATVASGIGCEAPMLGPGTARTAPPREDRPPPEPDRPRSRSGNSVGLYWCLGSVVRAEQVGFEPVILMTSQFIYDGGAKDNGRWNRRDKTTWFISRRIPRDYDGIVALDWEGSGMKIVHTPDHPQHEAVVGDFIELIRLVKQHRPRARVGYYGLPYRSYWNQDAKWTAGNDAVAPILAESDVVLPSCYDFYGAEPERDAERFGRIVSEALRVADGKPVIPWVMPYYHESTEQWGSQRIPEDEFIAHMRSLLEVEVNGRRPAGICVFGGGLSAYKNAFAKRQDGGWKYDQPMWHRIRRFFDTEMAPGETIEDFYRRWHTHVSCVVREAALGVPCREPYEPGRRRVTAAE